MWAEGDHARGIRSDVQLQQRLEDHAFGHWDEHDRHGGWIEFGKALPLVHLTANEPLDAQYREFGEFCTRTLEELLSLNEP
jgi:hypothetical protein